MASSRESRRCGGVRGPDERVFPILLASAGHVDQHQTSRRLEAARVIEGDRRPHRVADQMDVFTSQPFEEGLEVEVEGADFALFGVGVAVAPEIEGEARAAIGETVQVRPPMGVRAAPVKEDDGGIVAFRRPFEAMEPYAAGRGDRMGTGGSGRVMRLGA